MSLILFLLIFMGLYLFGRWMAAVFGAVWEHPGESLVFSISLGTVGVSLAVTMLAFLHLLNPVTGWILLGGMFLVSPENSLSAFHYIWKRLGRIGRPQKPLSGFLSIQLVLLTALGAGAWILASAPPIRTDALVYHLAIPKAYLEHGGLLNLPNNLYSFFPHLFEMVYLFAMMFGQENLPALVGLGNAAVLLTALACYFRNHLGTHYALLVPIVYFATPTFWEISASAYVDIALAGFVFLMFYSWDRWRNTGRSFWFGFMIVFAAAAWSTKLTAFIVLPLVGFAIVWEARRHKSLFLLGQQLFLFAGVVVLIMAPWWARNYYFSGNPFTPLFMQFFGGAEQINWDPARAALFNQYVSLFGMGRGIGDFFLLPFNLTFHSEPHSLRFDGQIGMVFLLLFPTLFGVLQGWNSRVRAMILVFMVLMVFWFLYFQYVRFLAPAFTFLTLLSVYGLECMTRKDTETSLSKVGRGIWQTTIVLGLAFNLTLISPIWLQKRPLDFFLGLETRDQYLTRNVDPYPMYQIMNRTVQKEDKVLFIFMRNLGYLAERPFYSDSIFEAHTLQKILQAKLSDAAIRDSLRELGVTHIMFDARYMWGRDAAFPPEHQQALKRFLKKRGELLARKNVYSLYRFVLD